MDAHRSLSRGIGWTAAGTAAALALALAGLAAAPPSLPPVPVAPPTVPAPTAASPAMPRGTLVEKVVAERDPSESYALYLPSRYDPARRWPIVYLFDARRHGMLPAARFEAAAETYGYILASSNDSASDGAFEPNLKAMQAMWADTHHRFSIDDKRVYAGGFSGTVRSSCTLALAVPGAIAGVIGAGAGFPEGQPPTAKTPFVFFATVGNLDFNFDEVTELDETLEDLRLPHRIEEFAGPHQWMPEDLATLSIQWVEVQAMRSGTRPHDLALAKSLYDEDLAKARSLEAAGDRLSAWHRYQAITEEYAGLLDTAPAAAKAAELAAAADVKARRRQRRELRERDREIVQGWQRTLAAADPAAGPVNLPRLFADLRIGELKGRAAKDPAGEETLAAKRLLSTLSAQTGFYLPQLYLERKNYRRAEICYAVAAEVEPGRPDIWYNLAATRSRDGQGKQAIEDLKHAVALGFKDAALLEKDDDFAALHGDPAFQDVLAGLRRQASAAGR